MNGLQCSTDNQDSFRPLELLEAKFTPPPMFAWQANSLRVSWRHWYSKSFFTLGGTFIDLETERNIYHVPNRIRPSSAQQGRRTCWALMGQYLSTCQSLVMSYESLCIEPTCRVPYVSIAIYGDRLDLCAALRTFIVTVWARSW